MTVVPDTMSERPDISTQTTETPRDQPIAGSDTANDDLVVSPDDNNTKKGRSLLKVPSRSSSQKKQTPSSGTGLSGPTVSDSRNSISGRSKDSKSSILGRQGNGSVSSKHTAGGDSSPTHTPGTSQPSSPMQKRKKKSGGLLSFLGCCAAPETGNEAEGEAENVHKLDKLPQRPATAKSRTQTSQDQNNNKAVNEKDVQASQTAPDQAAASAADVDQIAPVNGDASRQFAVPPAVTVEPPKKQTQDTEGLEASDNQDVQMQDAPPINAQPEAPVTTTGEEDSKALPGPPGPGSSVTVALPPADAGPSAPEPQKWLLPPIAPEHKGRKCLVLDLDETLVHSSFKVCHSRPLDYSQLSCANACPTRSCTKLTSRSLSRSRAITTTSMLSSVLVSTSS